MALALRLARRGLGQVWPNPAVGAVLVRPGDPSIVLARGSTAPGGRPHAEAVALARAGASARGATLYVTLEPCAHQGRGAPCADAIVQAGVARVVFALDDPDHRVDGRGLGRLQDAGVAVDRGVLEDEARWVTLGHVLRVTKGRPFVQIKLAVGSDGLMARGDGAPVWVTSEDARARAHLLRAQADAILVGRGTVEADDPLLTCRLPGLEARSPVRVVLDSHLRLPADAKLFKDAKTVPVWIVTAEQAPSKQSAALEAYGAEVLCVAADGEGGTGVDQVVRALAARGVTRLLVEGGPTVVKAFLNAGLADEVVVFQGAEPAGAGGLQPFQDAGLDRVAKSGQFKLHLERPIGPDVMRVYRR